MNRADLFAVPGRTLPFRMDSKPIIVLGDLALHFSPDLSVAPSTGHELPMMAGLGGTGGLISAGLSRLGVSVSILANRANDPVGATLEEMCQSLGVDTRYLFADFDDVPSASHIFGPAGSDKPDVSYVADSANLNLKSDDLRWVDWAQFGTLIVCSNLIAADPVRTAAIAAINAMRKVGGTVAFLVDESGPY